MPTVTVCSARDMFITGIAICWNEMHTCFSTLLGGRPWDVPQVTGIFSVFTQALFFSFVWAVYKTVTFKLIIPCYVHNSVSLNKPVPCGKKKQFLQSCSACTEKWICQLKTEWRNWQDWIWTKYFLSKFTVPKFTFNKSVRNFALISCNIK